MYKGINTTVDEGQTPIVVHGTQDPDIADSGVTHALGTNRGQENAVAFAAKPGGKQQTYVCQSLYNKGLDGRDINDASTQKTNTASLLSRVQREIGEEAFTEWGLGILDSLQPQEVLQQALHGTKFRQTTFSRRWTVCCAIGSPVNRAEGAMQSLREACGERRPPQGWGLLEQRSDELGAYLSELSQPGAQAERFMQDLRGSCEGAGLLREALSAIQKMGRPNVSEAKPAHTTTAVRRLTVEECEFLQGFPRGYTDIGLSDTARYKALGNSMAVPVMAWIGSRILRFGQ